MVVVLPCSSVLKPQASSRKEERSPANRESFPRSVPATVPGRPGRPGSFPLCCLGRAHPPFGLGRCVAALRSQGRSPANHFPGQCSLPYPIVPVLSRCVAWGVHARRSVLVVVLPRSVFKGGAPRINSQVRVRYRTRSSRFSPAVLLGGCRVPSSREEPRESFLRSVPATVPGRPGRPGSFPLCCLGRAHPPFGLGRCVAALRSQGRSPANHFPGQCSLPYPIVPVLSRCVAWGVHARRSVLVVVLLRSVLKGGAPRINSEVSVRYRTGSSQFFPAVRCDVDVRLCALLRPFGVCISRVNHPRVRLGSGLVTAALATTASAAPAAAVMSTDEAAAKAAYLARLEAESPFYTKKRGVTGAARASAVASMASSGSLSAATITEEAVAKATYLARMEAESQRGKERSIPVWPRRPRLHQLRL